MLRLSLCSVLVLIAGCARSEEARYSQVDNRPPPALNTADPGEEDELSVGTWQTALQEEQPVLEFGPVGATASFTFSCDARRNLLLQWPGAAPGGDLPNMLVTVGSETRRLAVTSAGGSGSPMLRGALAANDPFMRVLTGATTRIVVRMGDAPPLVMPPSPAIATYAQQCAGGAAQAASAPGNSTEASGSVNVVAGSPATANAQ